MYVIRRISDGKFVARPGSGHSYTQFLQKAMTYPTRESAEGNACENELAVPVSTIMRP